MTKGYKLRFFLQTFFTLGILLVLILILNPSQLGKDLLRFPLLLIPTAIGLTACFYILKGLRYCKLLRSVGVPVKIRTAVLFTVGGEAFGLLPLGELARAELTSEATKAPFGITAAAVTVQELLYTTVLIAIALPGAFAYAAGFSGILAALGGILLVLAILTVSKIFKLVLFLIRKIPFIKRFATQLEVFQQHASRLLKQRETWSWIFLSFLGALVELTLFWLIIRASSGENISWLTTTFIYGSAYLTGAVTSPAGGIGGFEGGVIALLHTQGVLGPAAVAAALLQRAADKGIITITGLLVWFWVRRKLKRTKGLLLGEGEVSFWLRKKSYSRKT